MAASGGADGELASSRVDLVVFKRDDPSPIEQVVAVIGLSWSTRVMALSRKRVILFLFRSIRVLARRCCLHRSILEECAEICENARPTGS